MTPDLTATLTGIADEMEQASQNGDNEVAHIDADQLLLRMLKAVSERLTDAEREQLERAVDAFEWMDKWYA